MSPKYPLLFTLIFALAFSPVFLQRTLEEIKAEGWAKPIKTADDYNGMVFIPAGEFTMGSDDASYSERPPHRVYLDAFFIDRFEVTNAQFERFVKDTGYMPEGDWRNDYTPGKENHPVVNVSWNDANAYVRWVGKRLPSEAEWEKAARGGLEGRKYPWGDEIDLYKANYDGKKGETTPVGNYPPNGYGLCDMSGNAWEWVADWYGEKYYQDSPDRNPKGPTVGSGRVLRGGAWDVGFYALRSAARNWNPPYFWDNCFGFRGAKSGN